MESCLKYTAESLSEIAHEFRNRASKLRDRKWKTQREQTSFHAQAWAWAEAATILENTTIVVPSEVKE